MSRRTPALALGTLALALALSACTPDASDDSAQQPAPETVTVTQTAPAAEPSEPSESDESSGSAGADDQQSGSQNGGSEGSSEESDDSEDSQGAQQGAGGSDDLTARGNIPKQVGEEASLTASSGGKALEFTVTDIQPGFQCTSPYAEAPENDNFVKVDITGSTGSAEDLEELFYSDYMMFNPYDWKFVDSSGQTANDIGTVATYGCLEGSESLTNEIGPGENVSGSLIFDITDSSGTLIYAPVYDSAGWEWSL